MITLTQALSHLHPLSFLSNILVLGMICAFHRAALGLLLRMVLIFHYPSQVVSDAEVERGGFEFDPATHDFCPFVSGGVDPPNEVEVVDTL